MLILALLLALASVATAQTRSDSTVLAQAEIIAFVGTTDAARARAFYEDVLGLRLVREEPSHAVVFDAGGRMLRVTVVPDVPPAAYTVLGWRVEDIASAVERLAARGLVFERFPGFDQDETGVWEAPDGTGVAWFRDPDGNLLSLTQFPADGEAQLSGSASPAR